MSKILRILVLFFLIIINKANSQENIMILKLKDGDVKIELFAEIAPNHVKRIKQLANDGKYDNVSSSLSQFVGNMESMGSNAARPWRELRRK